MKRPSKKQPTNQLLQALKNLDPITANTNGRVFETHVLLKDNWVRAYNGVMAAAEPILEDVHACPNNEKLIAALSKCGNDLNMTMLNDRLQIKSDKYRALIPCLNPDDMHQSIPDAPIAPIDDRLKASLAAVAPLPEGGIESIVTASILINGGSVIASDRHVIIEHWHGIDLPPNLALPKDIIAPILRNPAQLTTFGFSEHSATFYFENRGWIKTGLFAQAWPSLNRILDGPSQPWPIPEDFYKAVDAVAPLSETGNVYFHQGRLGSHIQPDAGATYEIVGLPAGPVFSIKQLKIVQPFVKQVDFQAPGPHGSKMMVFFGDMVRGAIAGREK